ncbi:exportin-T isoform X2 [Andrographis paniculata]|uniref:exportin-T isoform X2 n=1 Tax=Andrographis paniculata TaxID=175694 RepID=UPI0021E866F2|nr:exportin-T isoform X2 [Andrographis paniculata]
MIMDDLEKAVIISFDESPGVDSALKLQAVAFLQQAKENPGICSLCIQKLWFCNLVQVQFWCLQCLHDVVRAKYFSMQEEEKSLIRKSVFLMGVNGGSDDNVVRLLDGPAFIKNKLAQVLVALIYFEYPSVWPSLFVDFLPNLSKGASVIDMFCRMLNGLDDELISLDNPRNEDEIAAAGRIKDAMRAQCVPQIVGACYEIILLYKKSDPELCSAVLDSMSRYISWIDIGLIVNDVFTQMLFELMLVEGFPDQLRGASVGVVLAIVSKRMDPKPKLALLQDLQIIRVFRLVAGDGDLEFVSSVADLLTGYATEVLECSKSLSTEDGKSVALELLNEVLPSIFYVIQNWKLDSAFSIIQFFSMYVGMMKGLSTLTEAQLLHVGQMLEVIRSQIRIDPMYRNNLDMLDKVGREEEDRIAEFRKDSFVLLRSIGRVAPDVTQIFIRNTFSSAISSSEDSHVEEVEAALSLFYELGESLRDEAIRSGNGLLQELVPMLLSTKFPCHSHRLVALVYLDTITRYMKFVLENTQYIPVALCAFLDERGIRHPNTLVSRRAGYLFMRVVKLLKAKLVPYIDTILQSLQDIIAQSTRVHSASKELSGTEDGSHIFEAVGLLIGMEDVPLEKQSNYLSALLIPLCNQVESTLLNGKSLNHEESLTQIGNIQQIVMAINALSKGFSHKLATSSRPAIGLMFKQTLDTLLKILVVYPKVELLRSKVTSFIHRMVEILGVSVFPYLPKALEQLLRESEPKELVGFMVLLNQLICKFSIKVSHILEDVYPVLASRVFSILPKDDIPAGPGGCTEEIRELRELQKMFFTFLHVIATHDLSSIFILPKAYPYLEMMISLLSYTCCNHKDIVVRKACVQIIVRLIKDWCGDPYREEKVPGFPRFIIEAFAPNCCLYSVLDKSFDFRDANTMALFGEIVIAQKVMYEKFGNVFFLHFVSRGLRKIHCPQDLAEQYCQKDNDNIKGMRSFYQSLIEKLRAMQKSSIGLR